jgi:hypothetical protein
MEKKTIKIVKKDITLWNSQDFVKFFASKYELCYEKTFVINYVKDCTVMKRILTTFKKHDRPKTTITRFMDWVFEEYNSRKEFTTPLTIGFLPYWIDEYLQIGSVKKKTKKPEEIELDSETLDWLKQQKQEYRGEKDVK